MPEIFNITLQQAINCGTIPLVLNDKTAQFDHSWLDWANGCIVPHDKEEHLFNTMKSITNTQYDYEYFSNIISDDIKNKFNYNKFKQTFQEMMKGIFQ